MNRERLKTLRDHLAKLPDERVRMESLLTDAAGDDVGYEKEPRALLNHCGTAACIAGWANSLWGPRRKEVGVDEAQGCLGLTDSQARLLFTPPGYCVPGRYTRLDAIAAIDSMLANPDDDALPVWPQSTKEGAGS